MSHWGIIFHEFPCGLMIFEPNYLYTKESGKVQ